MAELRAFCVIQSKIPDEPLEVVFAQVWGKVSCFSEEYLPLVKIENPILYVCHHIMAFFHM